MIGTTMGEIRTAMIVARIGHSRRVRPRAAKVPSVVARIVARTATMMLFFSASIHTCESKNSRYHCSDNPGIG